MRVKLTNIKGNQSGIRACLKSGGVVGELRRLTNAAASRACSMVSADDMSEPFAANVKTNGVTAIGYVNTATPHGDRAEAKYHILQKCL